ncbi:ferritin heavy chain 1 [Cokeromyces recurvatus]|uniref:ferritin heavy chain 1 n=1 Tax=Cokeromyces recurvatus TaxID=90255 RepID=UPI0022202FB5|nr:ferritin heavy chain 1 [Cokeromyces recurvatus]KAI7901790.1 ferritin heavy chain 1 [Cokeromyces recurvatus]
MVIQSVAKQNFSQLAEDALNQQIQMYQLSQHTYLAASAYFDQADISLPGFAKFFHERAEHEGRKARKLIDYQMTRGGLCMIQTIPQPIYEWKSAMNAIESCLALEKDLNNSLLRLTALAIKQTDDAHLRNFLKREHLKYKVETIDHFVKGYTQLKRVGGEGLGLHLLDQSLYQYEKFTV